MKIETTHVFLLYGVTALTFFAIDLVWIGMVAKGFYANYVGGMMRENVNWVAALLFYAIYIGGIVVFVLIPALKNDSTVTGVLVTGALLGFFAYSTFDLTALALFKDWSIVVTIVDIAWGTLLTALTAASALWLLHKLLKLT